MSEAAPAASRSGGATGASSNARTGRHDGRAWRVAERALRLGRKHDVYAVEVNGVRFILKCEEKTALEPKGKKEVHARVSRPRTEPASAPAVRGLNHAKRKSAERMRKHRQKKGVVACAGSGQAGESPAEPAPTAAEPAPIEPDARMADAAATSATEGQRGQKRPADETPAPAPHSSSLPQQLQGYKGQRVGSPVEPTGQRSPGLRPLGHAECRRSYATAALEASRESRTSQG